MRRLNHKTRRPRSEGDTLGPQLEALQMERDRLATDLAQAKNEETRLRIETDKLRLKLAQEHEKRVRLEQDAEVAAPLLRECEALRKECDVLFRRLQNMDMRLAFFFAELPPFTAEKWIQRWQNLAAQPIDDTIQTESGEQG